MLTAAGGVRQGGGRGAPGRQKTPRRSGLESRWASDVPKSRWFWCVLVDSVAYAPSRAKSGCILSYSASPWSDERKIGVRRRSRIGWLRRARGRCAGGSGPIDAAPPGGLEGKLGHRVADGACGADAAFDNTVPPSRIRPSGSAVYGEDPTHQSTVHGDTTAPPLKETCDAPPSQKSQANAAEIRFCNLRRVNHLYPSPSGTLICWQSCWSPILWGTS